MKTPLLIAVITIVHVIAIGSVFFMQGCGTPPSARVDPPPAPVMPPREMPEDRVILKPSQPVFPASVPVERAPLAMDDDANVYVVKKGDMLSKIAVRHGVSAREIAELNNLKNMNDIRAGQKLLLPAYARSEKAPAKPAAAKPAAGTVSGDTYVVAAGDSLSKIAARFGVKTADLAAANSITNPNSIRVGQKLVVPKKASASAAAPKPSAVEVAPVEAIPALQPEAPVEEMIPAPAPVTVSEPVSASVSAGDSFTHNVGAGDTLDSVARSYAVLKKDLAAANGLSEDAVLSAGQKLIIPFSSSAMAP